MTGAGLFLGTALHALLGRRSRQVGARIAWAEIAYRAVRTLLLGGLALLGAWAGAHSLKLEPSLAGAADRTLLILMAVLLTMVGARLAADLVRAFAQHRAAREASSLFVNLTWIAALAIGLLVILETIGVSIAPLLTALGVGGLAVALALQDTLTNLMAGLHLLASKKVLNGDYVQLDSGQAGYVEDISWRNTAIRELSNNLVLVPNSRIASAVIVNYHRPAPELAVLVEAAVSYSMDLEHVEEVTVEVARQVMREVAGGIPDHDPFIRYHTLGQSNVAFSVILRGREFTDQYLIKHEFIKRLHRRYREEQIETPFPVGTIAFGRPAQGPLPVSISRAAGS